MADNNKPSKTDKYAMNAAAKRDTLAAHEDEFHERLRLEYEKRGFEYTPPKTDKDQARDLIIDTLNKHPELRREFTVVTNGKQVAHQAPAAPTEDVNLPQDDPIAGDYASDPEIPEGEDPWSG